MYEYLCALFCWLLADCNRLLCDKFCIQRLQPCLDVLERDNKYNTIQYNTIQYNNAEQKYGIMTANRSFENEAKYSTFR
jgi:hypothetical protein